MKPSICPRMASRYAIGFPAADPGTDAAADAPAEDDAAATPDEAGPAVGDPAAALPWFAEFDMLSSSAVIPAAAAATASAPISRLRREIWRALRPLAGGRAPPEFCPCVPEP